MGVHWERVGEPELAEHNARRLPANAWEEGELLESFGNLSLKLVHDLLGGSPEMHSLRAVVIDWAQNTFQLREWRRRKRCERRVALEELRGCQVNALVGALRREHDRDEELERGVKIELGARVGKMGVKGAGYGIN